MISSTGHIVFNKPPTKKRKNLSGRGRLPNGKKKVEFQKDEEEKQKKEQKQTDQPSKQNNQTNEENEVRQKLENLIEYSQPLYRLSTVFPFQFFPKEIVIHLDKVSIIDYEFFSSGRVQSIEISHISDVIVDKGPLFAKISIYDRYFTENSVTINYTLVKDAVEARKIIQGLMTSAEQGVDFTKSGLTLAQIKEKLKEIGDIDRGFDSQEV